MNKKKIIVLFVLLLIFADIWALDVYKPVTVTTTKTTYEYDFQEADGNEIKEEKKVERLKRSRTNSVSVSAGYFMPLDTSWAKVVLPVVSSSVTYTTPEAMFGDSNVGFSTSVRLSYSFEKERGVNIYRNHNITLSLPLNISVLIAENQTFKFSAAPSFSLSLINEKDVYAEETAFRTSSSFGLQALIGFSYMLNPSWTLDFEISSLIPFVNRTYIQSGISAGFSYRF